MCWRFGLKISSREGSSAMSTNQGKHSDHPTAVQVILTWLEHCYSTQRLDLDLDLDLAK